jgi:hypothetical protein
MLAVTVGLQLGQERAVMPAETSEGWRFRRRSPELQEQASEP